MYTYYFNEETCTLYKYSGSAFAEEYIDDAIEWRVVGINEIEGLEPISEEDVVLCQDLVQNKMRGSAS